MHYLTQTFIDIELCKKIVNKMKTEYSIHSCSFPIDWIVVFFHPSIN